MSKILCFELNTAGVREMLQSEGMQVVIQNYTDRVLENCGGASAGYSADVRVGKNRAVGRVSADSASALRQNEDSNSLLKGLHR